MRTNTYREDPDLRFQARTEVEVVNVSPFNAPIEIGGTPGSPPRRHMLKPGERVHIPLGYAHPYTSPARKEVPATIETMTMREAWPGKRTEGPNGYVWDLHPGPRLPMVVRLDRANEVRAQWDAAMEAKRAAQTAPMKLQLKRADGTVAEAEVAIDAPPEPRFRDAPATKATAPARVEEVDDYDATPFDPDPDDGTVPAVGPPPVAPAPGNAEPKGKKGK